jgi:hypothetical protein
MKNDRQSEIDAANARNLERADRIQDLRLAVGEFLMEFAAFESFYLTRALANLSYDQVLVEYLAELMDLKKRLDLLKHLGIARHLPADLMSEAKSVRRGAMDLLEIRNQVAHNSIVVAGASIAAVDPEVADVVIGVRLPKSKRSAPTANLNTVPKMMAAIEKWHITAPQIRQHTQEVRELQRITNALGDKLQQRRYPADVETPTAQENDPNSSNSEA